MAVRKNGATTSNTYQASSPSSPSRWAAGTRAPSRRNDCEELPRMPSPAQGPSQARPLVPASTTRQLNSPASASPLARVETT